ncbi:MAG: protein BatD [Alphaproteobacteria bacterium]|nr:protein BatD [Alphaproteobacteria bacterium]
MRKFWLILVVSLLFSLTARAESFVAKINRNPVPVGETFVLTLQYEGNPGTSQPELASLEKDFTIFSVGREYKSNTINGKTSRYYSWNVVMSPKKNGDIIIPSIAFKDLSTKPIRLKVANENAQGTNIPKFAIGRSISNNTPLVQEQIIYTLVIKTTEQLQGNLPQFSDNGNKDWVIKQLDNPVVTEEIDNGIEVKKIEIKYALFPQKSGKMTIPELRFNGYYVDENKVRNGYADMFNVWFDNSFTGIGGMNPAMSSVNLVAQPVNVDVKPIPQVNNGYWWLPSTQVEISSDWDKQLPEFKVGESVNRKIILLAAGVTESQLPKLVFPEVRGIKQYPENPQTESVISEQNIISKMEINVVYIPDEGGRITIPEIVVPWYNVKTKKMEKAILPAMEVNVIGQTVKPKAKLTQTDNNVTKNEDKIVPESAETGLPLKAIIGLIALAFALGLGASYVLLKLQQSPTEKKEESKKEVQPDVKKAIKSRDLKNIRDEVILWAKNNNPDDVIRNLDDVADLYNDEELSYCLKQLTAKLYSSQQGEFDFQRLDKVMSALSKKNKGSKDKKSLLPELYK